MKAAGKSSRDTGRTGKFKYKKPDPAKVKEHADQQGGAFDSIFKSGIDTFRAEQGDNTIRILPPTWEDQDHYAYLIWVHRRIGGDNSTYICPLKMKGDPCPICEAAREAKEAGEDDDAKALGVQKTYAAWVINRNDKKPVPLLYHMSWTMDRDIASICQNKKTGATLFVDHPDEGYDVTFTRKGTNLNTKYFGHQVDRESSPIDESARKQDEILEYIQENSIPNLLKIREYDYLEQVAKGKKAKSDEDEDADDADEKPKRRTRDDDDEEDAKPAKRRTRDDDDEDEKPAKRRARDDDDEDDGEKPVKKKPAKGDDDEDERPAKRRVRDDEDEDEKPAKRRARDDDEDERPAKRRSRDDDEDEAPRVRRK